MELRVSYSYSYGDELKYGEAQVCDITKNKTTQCKSIKKNLQGT